MTKLLIDYIYTENDFKSFKIHPLAYLNVHLCNIWETGKRRFAEVALYTRKIKPVMDNKLYRGD